MLPDLPYKTATRKQTQTQFGGIDRRAAAGNGAIADMANMTSDHAPVLASRQPRYMVSPATSPNGLFSDGEHLFLADGTTLYADGASVGAVTDTEKVFAALGRRIVIWPDKLLLRPGTEDDAGQGEEPPAWVLEALENAVETSCTFADGTYAGEAAEANTILASDSTLDWSDYFEVGDAVTITGAADEENNKTAIIREIAGNALRFYENSFTVNSTAANITVERTVPDLDFICVNDNRVWGCKGDTICCSKLGDPFNWNVFDGLSTDSWSWDSGTAGDFTGCVSFLGYPVFFKEEAIFKIYGSRPSNFEAMRSAATGVLPRAYKSLAVAGDVLYYLSRAGFMAYSGGMPAPVGAELERRYSGAVGGSDGTKYYVNAVYDTGNELLVFDTAKRTWHREDALDVRFMAWKKGLYAMAADPLDDPEDEQTYSLLLLGTPPVVPDGATAEGAVASTVIFADLDYQSFASKYPVRLWLRAEADAGVTLTVYIRYDGGDWLSAFSWTPGNKKSGYFPVPVRRCDHYALKIAATGKYKLYALETELYAGTTSRKG